jgi:hypothetical protein
MAGSTRHPVDLNLNPTFHIGLPGIRSVPDFNSITSAKTPFSAVPAGLFLPQKNHYRPINNLLQPICLQNAVQIEPFQQFPVSVLRFECAISALFSGSGLSGCWPSRCTSTGESFFYPRIYPIIS